MQVRKLVVELERVYSHPEEIDGGNLYHLFFFPPPFFHFLPVGVVWVQRPECGEFAQMRPGDGQSTVKIHLDEELRIDRIGLGGFNPSIRAAIHWCA